MPDLAIFLVAIAAGGALGVAVLDHRLPVLQRFLAAAAAPRKPVSAASDLRTGASAPPSLTPRVPEPVSVAAATALDPKPVPVAAAQASDPKPAPAAAAQASDPKPAPAAAAPAPDPKPAGEKDPGGRERRKFARLNTDEPILITPFAGQEIQAEVCDVSLGGGRFRIEGVALREGDMLRATFNLGGDPLSAVARVLRTRTIDESTTEVSVEFTRLDPWAARRFEEALREEG